MLRACALLTALAALACCTSSDVPPNAPPPSPRLIDATEFGDPIDQAEAERVASDWLSQSIAGGELRFGGVRRAWILEDRDPDQYFIGYAMGVDVVGVGPGRTYVFFFDDSEIHRVTLRNGVGGQIYGFIWDN